MDDNANAVTKTVGKSISDSRITSEQKCRLQRLALQPENKMDTSDIPELTDKFWKNSILIDSARGLGGRGLEEAEVADGLRRPPLHRKGEWRLQE